MSTLALPSQLVPAGLQRLGAIFGDSLRRAFRGPSLWILLAVLGLLTWSLSTGDTLLSTGAATVGGRHAWITSEFSNAFVFSVVGSSFYAFFASILAGLAVLDDQESRVEELLHSTRLTAGEYVAGKSLALLLAFSAVLALHLALAVVCNHLLPNADAADVRGPFHLLGYLRPALVFTLPTIVFFGGVSFYLGARLRRAAVAFLVPLVSIVASFALLWNWAPTWLDPRLDRLLMLLDPSGFRWLDQTWLQLDRGAGFYNTAGVGFDSVLIANRLLFLALGIGAVVLARRHVAPADRGRRGQRRWFRRRAAGAAAGPVAGPEAEAAAAAIAAVPRGPAASAPAASLQPMTQRAVSRPRQVACFARAELGALLREPALYVFWLFVLSQSMASSLLVRGAFQTRVLVTPGRLAVGSFNTLTAMVCVLILYFLVEALERERATGVQPLVDAAPYDTGSRIAGKVLAMSLLAALVLSAVFLAGLVVLRLQGAVSPAVGPYLAVWGLALLPTFLLWTCFIAAVHALSGSRLVTLGTALGAFGWTLYLQLTDGLTWVGNWLLWGTLRWTDFTGPGGLPAFGAFRLDGRAILLNRLLALALAGAFLTLAVHFARRRSADATRLVHRLQPRLLARRLWRLSPALVVPALVALPLWFAVAGARDGEAAHKADHDYWKQNYATWHDAPEPAVSGVDVDLWLDPAGHAFRSHGTFALTNHHDEALRRFALTGGAHWRDVTWTLDGEPFVPEDRSGLYVFAPAAGLAPGGTTTVGFELAGRFPAAVSKGGGELWQFILPEGVVLTSFHPSFVPVVGFDRERGIDDDNRMDPREVPDDYYRQTVVPAFASPLAFPVRLAVDTPQDYRANGVGVLASEVVEGGRRKRVWVSDHDVRYFNVVAGRWKVYAGETTEIDYHPGHEHNLEAMSRALEGARRYYSEWFAPYPWKDLRLSEFPAHGTYAQGFPSNITFSENIGFLTKADEKTDAVLLVTAHEAAHQWWGNLLSPGDGPGGNVLSEGMAHFSTLLLFEQLEGPAARRELAKRFEESYGDHRRKDAERPLVKIDGTQPGDGTVTYEKGGWAFWMLLRHMGRDRMLAGLHAFIAEYQDSPDHPLIEDLLATLRPFADDPAAFDAFTRQWFFDVVVPEYRFRDEQKERRPDGTWRASATLTNAGSGEMEVEVAATAGERSAAAEGAYRESRSRLTLGAGESRRVEIECGFEPQRLVVDPDAEVLMLNRKEAVVPL